MLNDFKEEMNSLFNDANLEDELYKHYKPKMLYLNTDKGIEAYNTDTFELVEDESYMEEDHILLAKHKNLLFIHHLIDEEHISKLILFDVETNTQHQLVRDFSLDCGIQLLKIYGTKYYIGTSVGSVYCFDILTHEHLWLIKSGTDSVSSINIKDDKILIGLEGRVDFYNLETQIYINHIDYSGNIVGITNNKLFALRGSTMLTYDMVDDYKENIFETGRMSCAFLTDECLIIGYADGNISLWDPTTLIKINTFKICENVIANITLKDGKIYCLDIFELLKDGYISNIYIIDLISGNNLHTFRFNTFLRENMFVY